MKAIINKKVLIMGLLITGQCFGKPVKLSLENQLKKVTKEKNTADKRTKQLAIKRENVDNTIQRLTNIQKNKGTLSNIKNKFLRINSRLEKAQTNLKNIDQKRIEQHNLFLDKLKDKNSIKQQLELKKEIQDLRNEIKTADQNHPDFHNNEYLNLLLNQGTGTLKVDAQKYHENKIELDQKINELGSLQLERTKNKAIQFNKEQNTNANNKAITLEKLHQDDLKAFNEPGEAKPYESEA